MPRSDIGNSRRPSSVRALSFEKYRKPKVVKSCIKTYTTEEYLDFLRLNLGEGEVLLGRDHSKGVVLNAIFEDIKSDTALRPSPISEIVGHGEKLRKKGEVKFMEFHIYPHKEDGGIWLELGILVPSAIVDMDDHPDDRANLVDWREWIPEFSDSVTRHGNLRVPAEDTASFFNMLASEEICINDLKGRSFCLKLRDY